MYALFATPGTRSVNYNRSFFALLTYFLAHVRHSDQRLWGIFSFLLQFKAQQALKFRLPLTVSRLKIASGPPRIGPPFGNPQCNFFSKTWRKGLGIWQNFDFCTKCTSAILILCRDIGNLIMSQGLGFCKTVLGLQKGKNFGTDHAARGRAAQPQPTSEEGSKFFCHPSGGEFFREKTQKIGQTRIGNHKKLFNPKKCKNELCTR